MQRWFGVLMAGVLVVGAAMYTAPAVQAEELLEKSEETMELYQQGDVPALDPVNIKNAKAAGESDNETSLKKYEAFTGVEQVLYNGMLNAQTSINISSYGLSNEAVKAAMQNIINCSPELFYIGNSYGYTYRGNVILTVEPKYLATGSTLAQQKNEYNAGVRSIVNNVKSNWTTVEKVLYVHDYLAQNYEYDTSYAIYDAHQFFLKKKGVCQAYTAAFLAAMNELKIPCTVATSSTMNHIWNLVQIDGAWYHVDVTYDDPLFEDNNDLFGLALHNNLLLSDTAIQAEGHSNWSTPYGCSRKTYDNAFWIDSNSPFQYLKDQWYYTVFDDEYGEGDLYSCKFTSITNVKYGFELSIGTWPAGDGYFWSAVYSGLSAFGDRIYFNTANAICSYEPVSGTVTEEFRPTQSGFIYGMRINDSTLYYAMGSTPQKKTTVYSKKISSYHDPINPVTIYGDSDGNGKIELKDGQLALKTALRIINPNQNVRQFMNVDGEGDVTMKDAQLILKYALKIIKVFPVESAN